MSTGKGGRRKKYKYFMTETVYGDELLIGLNSVKSWGLLKPTKQGCLSGCKRLGWRGNIKSHSIIKSRKSQLNYFNITQKLFHITDYHQFIKFKGLHNSQNNHISWPRFQVLYTLKTNFKSLPKYQTSWKKDDVIVDPEAESVDVENKS